MTDGRFLVILNRETPLITNPNDTKLASPGKFHKMHFSKMATKKMMIFRNLNISAVYRSRIMILTPNNMFTRTYIHILLISK